MRKEIKRLCQIVKKLKGNVLVIGITEESVLKALEENQDIVNCNLLNATCSNNKETQSRGKKKNFNIKNLRKKFHHKKVDAIICNTEEIYPHIKTFIKDSIYINSGKIYFYGEKKLSLEKITKKYKRYGSKIETSFIEHYFFLTVSNEHCDTNKIKDTYFLIQDFLKWLYETVGDLLIN